MVKSDIRFFLEVFVMVMPMMCAYRFSCWPLGPIPGLRPLVGLLAVAGVIFSIVMLVDCLKRPRSKFVNPISKNGEYDKLIWAAAIVASFWFYFLGAIIYFFVVRKAKAEKK